MSAVLTQSFKQAWERYRARPFALLVRLFCARIFHGGGDGDNEGLDMGVGLVLSLLALPGGFVSVLLLNKYSTLLQWMSGQTAFDPLVASLPDEYFFIVLSMVVAGIVAVWRWDSILPDSRDYLNLVPLPIAQRTIFFANLVTLLFFAAVVALDVNAASSILFPVAVASSQDTFGFFVKFAAVHTLGVVLASVFAFFAVFSTLGLLMAILPRSIFRRISVYARAIVVACLVTLLSTSFAVPATLLRLPEHPHSWVRFLPSCWFLGLCQSIRARAEPDLAALGRMALPAIGVALGVAACVYAVSYRRYFSRITETTPIVPSASRSIHSRLGALIDGLVLRTPFQKGCFHFVAKTLFRSEHHRLVLAGFGGLGLVLSSEALMNAFGSGGLAEAALSARVLSVPFIFAFCIVVGLRLVFEIPVEQRCNWIFRFMLDVDRHECGTVARKVILISVLPWVLLVVFPIYVYLEGWTVGCLHAFLVIGWSMLLTNTVLVRFRKLPFTCAFPLFQQYSIVTLLGYILGFVVFVYVTPQFESWALAEPVRMIGFVPVAAVAWYIPRRIGQNAMEIERGLIFEEAPTRAVEILQLSD
jgi:hypothetical protein